MKHHRIDRCFYNMLYATLVVDVQTLPQEEVDRYTSLLLRDLREVVQNLDHLMGGGTYIIQKLCPCKRRLCLHTAHYTLPFSKCVYRKKSIKEVNFAQYELSWCETFVDVNVHYEKIILPVWNFQLLKYLTKTLSLKIFGKSKNSKFPAGIELLAYRFVANGFFPFI